MDASGRYLQRDPHLHAVVSVKKMTITMQTANTVLALLAVCLWGSAASAQGPPGQPGPPGPRLELSISPTVINFPPGDPDLVPQITSVPITVTYRIRQAQGLNWQLTVLASGHLMSGPSTVDITNVTWVATPAPPFRSGTLNHTVAQVMAAGVGNVNPTATGSVTFRLKNSWTYDSGTYTQTVVFTLSTP